jgi:hypothetical protein
MQTECIDTIPEGYYLSDEIYGTIEKCHRLCKACKSGPYKKDGKIHMNCDICLYENKLFRSSIKGNCPELFKKSNKKNKHVGLWIFIIILLVCFIVALILGIIYFKNKIRFKRKNNTDYYNIGKIMPFDDENSLDPNINN